jgi:LysR family transcriptional regulator, benzoate and cis,cis-muconate-responsive activator of ben and cat genes
MELRHLRYFVAVSDELNFTRAANKLRVAQPALSRQIRDLEDELGIKLLARNHRGVELTDAGKAFRTEAIALLKQSEQAVQVARRSGKAGAGQQNIGYIWGLFHSITPPLLNDFRQRFPETAVHLFDLSPIDQAMALLENKLDAGFIGFAQEADDAHLQKRKVGVCQFYAALPEAHQAAKSRTVPLANLADEFFLGISDQTYPAASRYVVEACERAGFRPKFLQMVERGYTILGLVAGKCGVALVPESLKALPHQGVVFRPLADPIRADLFIAWNGKHSEILVNELLKPLK